MFKVWLDAALAVFFGVYAVAFFVGVVEPDGLMAGLMAISLFFVCVKDSITAYVRKRDERKGG